jgi:ubiquinone biosynthesis protein
VEEVQQDSEILQNLAARASRRWEAAAGIDLVGVTVEFARTLRAELDYLHEARATPSASRPTLPTIRPSKSPACSGI